jgi:hypothetical protein
MTVYGCRWRVSARRASRTLRLWCGGCVCGAAGAAYQRSELPAGQVVYQPAQRHPSPHPHPLAQVIGFPGKVQGHGVVFLLEDAPGHTIKVPSRPIPTLLPPSDDKHFRSRRVML